MCSIVSICKYFQIKFPSFNHLLNVHEFDLTRLRFRDDKGSSLRLEDLLPLLH